MNVVQRPAMSGAEFLEWEAAQDYKWEFDGFQPVAMTGGTDAHAAIQANLLAALVPRLRGSPCRARGSDLKVMAGLSYRYPDAFVSCTPVSPTTIVTAEPVVIFKVLLPSTAAYDRTTKLAEYRALPTTQRIVLLEQDRAFATVIARTGEEWSHLLVGLGGTLAMPEIGISIPMTELYDGLDFTVPDPAVASG